MKWWKSRPRWMKKMKGRRKKRKEEAMMDSSSERTVIMSTTTDWWLQDMNTDKIRALEEVVGDCKPPKKQRVRKKVKKGAGKSQPERRVTFHASPAESPPMKREPPATPVEVSSIMKRRKPQQNKEQTKQAPPFTKLSTIATLETFLAQLKVFLEICYQHLEPHLPEAIKDVSMETLLEQFKVFRDMCYQHIEPHLPEAIKDEKLLAKLMTSLYSYYHQKLVPHLPAAITAKIDVLLQCDDLTTALSDCLEELQAFPLVCYQQLTPYITTAVNATAKTPPVIWIFNDDNLAVLSKVLTYLHSLLDNGYQQISPYLPIDRATKIYQNDIVPHLSTMANFFQFLSTLLYSYYYQLQQVFLQPYIPTAMVDIPTTLQFLFQTDDKMAYLSHFFSSLSPCGVTITSEKEEKSDSVMVVSWCSSMTLQDLDSSNNSSATPQKLPDLDWPYEESPPSPTKEYTYVLPPLLSKTSSWNQDTKTTTRTIKSQSTQQELSPGTLQAFILTLQPFVLLMNHWMILFKNKVEDYIPPKQKQVKKEAESPIEIALNDFVKVMFNNFTIANVQTELYNAFHKLSATQTMMVVGFWIFVLVLWPLAF